jgi:hypothetical protein
MAWENRLASDMMLPKRGGVCIPNNTAPDGIIIKALQGLTSLSNKLAENSGINDPFTDLMEIGLGDGKAG